MKRVARSLIRSLVTIIGRVAGHACGSRQRRLIRSLDRAERERREAYEALRDGEARLKRVIEATHVGTWEWNARTDEMTLDERWAGILGYSLADLGSVRISEMIRLSHPEDSRRVARHLEEVFSRSRSHFDVEYRVKHCDGGWVWIHDRGSVVEWTADGCPLRMAGTRTDVSDRRALECQLHQAQKMESIGRLAGGIAHDFNNMLGVILGHTEMALEAVKVGSPLATSLQEIRKAAQRSAELTRQLLAFARKQAVAPRVLDLNETVLGMLTMLRRLIGEDIELNWRPQPALWPINADPAQITQILANLSVNARDAISGTGVLTIRTGHARLDNSACAAPVGRLPGEYVFLSVTDTGTGMDKTIQDHLFEPFFTTKEVGKGTGLGLAMVYGAVKQNQGFINVDSEPGRGTTFTIYLPKAESTVMEEAALTPRPRYGQGTVLLAEDEEAILRMGRMILTEFGYTVLTARDAGEALALARHHEGRIDLLVTDVVMPGMNGRELRDELSALFPRLKTLFISGYTPDVIAPRGVIDEGIEFLPKPFSVVSLTAKVHEMLRPRASASGSPSTAENPT